MNDKLKKTKKPKHNKQAKYMLRHKTLCVCLEKEDDADILGWLDRQENRSASVRAVLRREALNGK